jgi:hypothetical protein
MYRESLSSKARVICYSNVHCNPIINRLLVCLHLVVPGINVRLW